MKTSKIKAAAIEAKKQGYEFIAAVVKTHYATAYYNVQSVDDIIKAGKWPAASRHYHGYRLGQSQLPEKTIKKSRIMSLLTTVQGEQTT